MKEKNGIFRFIVIENPARRKAKRRQNKNQEKNGIFRFIVIENPARRKAKNAKIKTGHLRIQVRFH